MKPKKKLCARELPDLGDPRDLDPAELHDGAVLEDARVARFAPPAQSIRGFAARRALLENLSLAGAQLYSVKLRDVRLVNCDLSNAVLHSLECTRVEFIDCRLTGLNASGCRMEDILFERCNLSYTRFSEGRVARSEFVDTQAREADWRGADFEHAKWTRADLSRADLTGARLMGADLRGADIAGLVVDIAALSGATVSPSQAMDLARLLGVIVG